jgi:hypothetical protein
MPSFLDSNQGLHLLRVVCMNLPIVSSIYRNTAKKTTSVVREKDSPKPKKTAKG